MNDIRKVAVKAEEGSEREFRILSVATLVFIAVLLLVGVLFATSRAAHAEEGFQWKHFGTDPYASTRVEAMRSRESAFRAMGLPTPVIRQFLQVTEKPGEKTRIVVGDHFSAMLSRGGLIHRDVTVAFAAPIRGMEYAAPAEKWEVFWQGKIFTIFLPEICFNWSFKSSDAAAVTVATASCATLNTVVAPGDEVRFAVLSRNRLPASACWQLCDGDDCSMLPSPCDTCDWVGPLSVIPTGFVPLHTGRYVAKSAKQSLRFPSEAMSNYVALCDERTGLGQSDAVVVTPQDWQGRNVHHTPREWPMWGTTGKGSYKLPGK